MPKSTLSLPSHGPFTLRKNSSFQKRNLFGVEELTRLAGHKLIMVCIHNGKLFWLAQHPKILHGKIDWTVGVSGGDTEEYRRGRHILQMWNR
jgi:hypothetical protein